MYEQKRCSKKPREKITMGSAKITNAKPTLAMAENTEKKSIKTILKSLFKRDKKEKPKEKVEDQKLPPPVEITPVSIIESFKKLEVTEEDDELKQFEKTIIKDDKESRIDRIDSHSSEDSGFSDTKDDKKDLAEELENLKISDKCEKQKKLQKVKLPRGPIRNRGDFAAVSRPYPGRDINCDQINQINPQTLSGGQVIVNTHPPLADNCAEINQAITQIEYTILNSNPSQLEDELNLADEYVSEQQKKILPEEYDGKFYGNYVTNSNNGYTDISSGFTEVNNYTEWNYDNFDLEFTRFEDNGPIYPYPTPPRSDNIPSPQSDSQGSFYKNSDYTLSPEMSSPNYNSDYEKYQEISPINDFPNSVEKDEKERKNSVSSMTMKQFKDLQKEITSSFSKLECCQLNRKACDKIFLEHIEKLKMEERKQIVIKITNMDLNSAYGVLHQVLLSLSRSDEKVDLQYALFSLICNRILSQKPALFVGDFGLSLIKSAALRCNTRPLLTRYLVECVRAAVRADKSLVAGREIIFHEVDALGDNLLIACVRAGDDYAPVLSELVRTEQGQPPLFKLHHANTDGYSALHVCCITHSASSPRVHSLHVLLEHARADLFKGDIKGDDTALHLAVNSGTCDLRFIMVLFRHVDRKQWKELAHRRNRSSLTPLDYARRATKTSTRPNYPTEVLDFLKKCR